MNLQLPNSILHVWLSIGYLLRIMSHARVKVKRWLYNIVPSGDKRINRFGTVMLWNVPALRLRMKTSGVHILSNCLWCRVMFRWSRLRRTDGRPSRSAADKVSSRISCNFKRSRMTSAIFLIMAGLFISNSAFFDFMVDYSRWNMHWTRRTLVISGFGTVYGTLRYSTVRYGSLRYGSDAVRWNAVRCLQYSARSAVWYGAVLCGVMQCGSVQCREVPEIPIRYKWLSLYNRRFGLHESNTWTGHIPVIQETKKSGTN